MKPLLGCKLVVAPTSRFEKRIPGQPAGYYSSLVKNEGCKNLCKLSSLANLGNFYYTHASTRSFSKVYAKDSSVFLGPIQEKSRSASFKETKKS
jgi:DNA polymerase III alpha subunit